VRLLGAGFIVSGSIESGGGIGEPFLGTGDDTDSLGGLSGALKRGFAPKTAVISNRKLTEYNIYFKNRSNPWESIISF